MKFQIKKNRWDNWYGYQGRKKVISFMNTSEAGMEDLAKAWLCFHKMDNMPTFWLECQCTKCQALRAVRQILGKVMQ